MGLKVDFLSVLCILFIFLKLFKIIDWSWLWVLSPIWLPLLIFLCIGGIIFIIAIIIIIILLILDG